MKNIFLSAALALTGIGTVLAQNIVALEYAVDTDSGFGDNTSVMLTPAPDGTFSFSVNTAGLSKGYHTLYFRTRNSDGKWSHTCFRTIEILDDVAANRVEGAELFDNILGDFGTGVFMTFGNPQSDGSFVLNFPYSQVTAGDITLFSRVKDSKGLWSFPAEKSFTIVKQNDPPNHIRDIIENSFSIYPNPARSELNIEFKERPEAVVSFYLIDIAGKTVQAWETRSARTVLPLSQPGGNYFLKIQYREKETVQKLTIIK